MPWRARKPRCGDGSARAGGPGGTRRPLLWPLPHATSRALDEASRLRLPRARDAGPGPGPAAGSWRGSAHPRRRAEPGADDGVPHGAAGRAGGHQPHRRAGLRHRRGRRTAHRRPGAACLVRGAGRAGPGRARCSRRSPTASPMRRSASAAPSAAAWPMPTRPPNGARRCSRWAATLVARRPRRREREVAAEDWFQGVFTTAIGAGEILAEVRLPLRDADWRCGFAEFSRRAGDFALAMAVVVLRVEGGVVRQARIALGGIGGRPLLAREAAATLIGQRPGAPPSPARRRTRRRSLRPAGRHPRAGRISPRPCAQHGSPRAGAGRRSMTWVGRSLRRFEDPALLRGEGRFTADVAIGAQVVRFLRSPVACGRIVALRPPPEMPPGAVFVSARGDGRHRTIRPMLHRFAYRAVEQPVLPTDRVHFVGQPIAAIAAGNGRTRRGSCRGDRGRIRVGDTGGWTRRRVVGRVRRTVHVVAPGNVAVEGVLRSAECDAAFAAAPHVVESPSGRAGRTRRRWKRGPVARRMTARRDACG